ncbi:hypothetical protein [Kitasatospora sp. NPDC088783]|uniref:hypothetical protein n=1 Tax=Kitasatospora sp. NPDC088783 TaxID=3364077 RepID=UPI00382D71DD
MPTLTAAQVTALQARLSNAAVLPHQRRAAPRVAAMAAVGPDADSSSAAEHILALVRQERGGEPLRGAIEVASKALLHNALPSGSVVAVGARQDDVLGVLAQSVLCLHLAGESTAARMLQQYDVPRHAAVLALLAGWLNFQLAGVDPLSL